MTVPIQRPLKGSRISSFYPVKTLPHISALDSAFQLQEYISLLIRLDVHDVEKIVAIPGKDQNDTSENGAAKGDEKDADKDAAGGVNVDPACWVYEHLRRVAQDLSHPLITMLQQECTRSSCPEMKAGEWLYLCVAHGNEGAMEQCCAIDYILHTLDSATALLNSPRAFPSRLSVPSTSHRHFTSLCRRLGRIFAHAYFHHREVFEQAEAESSLYARFLALVKYFDLVPLEFLVIPPRMEGRAEPVEPPRLMGAALEPRRDVLRPKSPPGPAGTARNESPRKFGRARTDTMVYSEAFSVAEELAKGDLSEVDIDREIAAERAASLSAVSEPFVPQTELIVPPPAVGPESVYVPEVVPIPGVTVSSPPSHEATQPPEETASVEPAPSEPSTESEEGEPSVATAPVEAPSEEPTKPLEEISAPATEESGATAVEETPTPAAEPVAEPAREEPDVVAVTEDAAPEETAEAETSEAESPAQPEASDVASSAGQSEETETEVVPETALESVPAAEEAAAEEPAESSGEPAEEGETKEPSESTDSVDLAETASYAAVAAAAPEDAAPTEEAEEAEEAVEDAKAEKVAEEAAVKEPEVPPAAP